MASTCASRFFYKILLEKAISNPVKERKKEGNTPHKIYIPRRLETQYSNNTIDNEQYGVCQQ